MSSQLSRRHFIGSGIGLAGMSLTLDPRITWLRPATAGTDASSFVANHMARLERFHARFLEADNADLASIEQFQDWQRQYDRLVGAADTVRKAITDDTPDRDALVQKARTYVEPSCGRAILYWRPIEDMSQPFEGRIYTFFAARTDWICSIAQRACDPDIDLRVSAVVDASSAVRSAMPATRGDRSAMRRVIEAFRNDDMVDVSIVRGSLEEHQVRSFRDWARPCGSFNCKHCEAWLNNVEDLT